MDYEDDYVCPDVEYDFAAAPEEVRDTRFYGEDAEEVDLRTVDMTELEILSLRDRLLEIGTVYDPELKRFKKDPAFEWEAVKSWEGFFAVKPTQQDCTLEVYSALKTCKPQYYIPWFEQYTVAQICKCVKAMVIGTLPTVDGGFAARAYSGKAALTSDGTWVDRPEEKILSLTVTKRLASSAQMFCASVDLKMEAHIVESESGGKVQNMTCATVVPANVDGSTTIDPLWKTKFAPLLQLPIGPDKKIKSDPVSVRRAPFVWSVIGRKHSKETLVSTGIRPMNHYLFWKKELYPIAALPVNLKDLFECMGSIIPRSLIAKVIENSIWVGGFPTPGDAITAKFICSSWFENDARDESLALSGPFSKGVIGFCVNQCAFEGPNVRTGNPDLDHAVVSYASNNYKAYTGVYWNPTTRHIPFLVNIAGIVVPYSSAPAALSVVWDYLKFRCSAGCRVYATYGANPALWVIASENGWRYKTSEIQKLYKSCGWMAIVNFATCTARGFYSKAQSENPAYLKHCIWAADLHPQDGPVWHNLEENWVPGRWIDTVAAIDLSVPPDLWDDDTPAAPAADKMEDDGPMDDAHDEDAPAPKRRH